MNLFYMAGAPIPRRITDAMRRIIASLPRLEAAECELDRPQQRVAMRRQARMSGDVQETQHKPEHRENREL